MKKLLLINPKFPESFWSFKWAIKNVLPGKKTVNPPLGLATLAALCPKDWDVTIVDENIESIPKNPDADIIGICGMGVQFERQKELIAYYRSKGFFVVVGGSYASLCPEAFEGLVDTVVAGEVEYIWKDFCQDFEANIPKKLYQETGVVSMEDSPTPRFDLLKLKKYQAVNIQFSRGCPFQCEFCDIIVMFGRKPRTKLPEQIGKELDILRKQGITNVFFVDDNLIGNKPLAKKLLRYLIEYQRKHNYKFYFGTEASINMAHDTELLKLFNQAGFVWVFIGIESPDENSLKETNKKQNTNQDILTSVRQIYAHGIEIYAGFIVGFDNDTSDIFEKQYQFIIESGIQASMIGLLTALPKTPLYKRLQNEGRLLDQFSQGDNTKLGTNLIPKQMSYQQMINGYRSLYHRLLTDRNIANRIKNKVKYLVKTGYAGQRKFSEEIKILGKFLINGLLKSRFSRLYHFARSLPYRKPKMIPLVIQDWIVGITMQDYVKRHFTQNDILLAEPSNQTI